MVPRNPNSIEDLFLLKDRFRNQGLERAGIYLKAGFYLRGTERRRKSEEASLRYAALGEY